MSAQEEWYKSHNTLWNQGLNVQKNADLIISKTELFEALQCLFNKCKSIADYSGAGNRLIENEPDHQNIESNSNREAQ
jgi:hypothetical protein